MDAEYFAEGLSFVNDTVYQLTYKSNKILVWSLGNEEPKLDEIKEMPSGNSMKEGWGLAYNKELK